MATLQKIRNRGVLLMLIVGLALFAFIIGDAVKNSSTYFAQAANRVGEIDGEPVSYEEYRKEVGINLQNAEAQRGGLSSQQREAVELQTWNQIIERKVVGREMEELGIAVTTDELSHIFTKKTDADVRDAFGAATAIEIAEQVAQLERSGNAAQKAQLNNFKEYVKEKRVNEKYFSLLAQGLKADNKIVAKTTADGKANFKYIMRSYASIPDSTVAVSDDEIKTYYNNHKELFKQAPSREILYVKIDVEPSQEDKDFAMKAIEDIKVKFAKAKNPLRFAVANSEVQPRGNYLKRDEIKDADLAVFAFSDSKGVYGPYGEGNILQITRIADRKMLPDSVRASHILLPAGETTEAKIDSLMNLLKKGADFATLARANSVDKGSAVNGGDLGWFLKGRMVPSFEMAAFETKKGKLTTVQTQFGTHIIKVTGRSPLKENVQLATVTRETSPSNKTFQLALTDARHIAENVTTADELEAAAKEKSMITLPAFFTAASMGVRDVENSKALVRAAFRAEDTNVLLKNSNNSTVFEMEGCYIIAGLKKIQDGEYAQLDDKQTKDFITAQLRKEKKGAILSKEMKEAMVGVNSLTSFAEKEGVTVQEANNVTFNSNFVAGLGQEPAVVAAALLQKNTGLSAPIVGVQGVFVLADVVKKAETSTVANKVDMYNRMLQQRTRLAYQALFDNAEITDERYKF